MGGQTEQPLSFERVGDGKYRIGLISAHGRLFGLLVKKESVMNPSARGGAYKDEWIAYSGALYVKERGESRIEATRKALAVLAAKGITPEPTSAPSD